MWIVDYSVPRKDCIVCHYPIWSEVCGQYSDEALCNFKFGFGLLVLLYTIKFMFYALKYLLQHQPTLVLPQIQISLERWFPEDWVLLQSPNSSPQSAIRNCLPFSFEAQNLTTDFTTCSCQSRVWLVSLIQIKLPQNESSIQATDRRDKLLGESCFPNP